MDVDMAPGHFARNIGTRHRLPDYRVRRRITQRRFRADLECERPVADEIGIADASTSGLRADRAVDSFEVRGRLSGTLARTRDQRLPRRRRGLAYLHTATHDSRAARRRPLVWRQRGVSLDHRDPPDVDAEFLRRHLRDRDTQSLSARDFPAENRHRSVGFDGEKAVHLVRVERACGNGAVGWRPLRDAVDRPGKTDDERTAGFDAFAAGPPTPPALLGARSRLRR